MARLVVAVSKAEGSTSLPEEKVAKWEAEREYMLAAIDNDSLDAIRLKAADSLANVKAILRDIRNPEVGSTVWARFKVGKEESLWYYNEILKRAKVGLASEPIVSELEATVRDLRNS